MENKRRFREKVALAESMKGTARTNQIVVAGQSGSDILGFYNDAIDQVSKR
jgi:hypothetical protein